MTPQKSEFAQMRDDYITYLREFSKRRNHKTWQPPLDFQTFSFDWRQEQEQQERSFNRAQMAHVRSMTDQRRYI